MKRNTLAAACLAAALCLSAWDAALAGQGYLSITPSVNFVRVKDSLTVDTTPVGGPVVSASSRNWDTAPGIGISAGLIAASNWQLGLGYEYVGRIKNHARERFDQFGPANVVETAYDQKVDMHNLNLQARYNFPSASSRFGFFAYGKVGATMTRVTLSNETVHYNGALFSASPDRESKTRALFSYGLGAGASYCFTPSLSGELSGEFFQAASRKFSSDGGDSYKIGAIGFKLAAGLTWKF